MTQGGKQKQTAPPHLTAKDKAVRAEAALIDKRARGPIVLDMRDITLITDYFVVCHGTSNVHIRALGDAVVEALKEEGVRPHGVEGRDEGRWVLLDYGDLIVHIFAEEEREFYGLERLWSDAPRLEESEAPVP